MELGFIQNGEHRGRLVTHRGQAFALQHGQSLGAGEMDQEQVILDQIMLKRFERQRASREPLHKRVPSIIAPFGRSGGGQLAKQAAFRAKFIPRRGHASAARVA